MDEVVAAVVSFNALEASDLIISASFAACLLFLLLRSRFFISWSDWGMDGRLVMEISG